STITGPVGSEVYTHGVAFPSTPNPWEDIPSVGFADFAPQAGSTRKIMCNDARMQNTVYRNGFLWCAHTVFLPAGSGTRSSVQWWKISTAGAVSQRGRMDDPSGNLFYAFPSIAVNKNDAVLIGYSRFSAAQFAGGNYSYRIATDPANTLRNDTVLKAGEAKYDKDFGSGRNRWGDYTNTVVDPVNDVDMWTIQEYAAPRVTGADRWGTWWGRIPEPSDPCNPDTVPPVLNCPANLVQNNAPGQCSGPVTFSPTASDDCGIASLVCTPASGSTFPVGLTSVTCIAADTAGNADTCTFSVTVSDAEPPQASCPASTVVNNETGSCAATVSFAANVSDNCPGATVACAPPSGSSFPVGLTTVTCIAADSAGNADTCTFTVTVNDTENPQVTCPANILENTDPGQCSAAVNFSATASDNCPGVVLVCTPPSGSVFPAGLTDVNCVATDGAGNKDSCQFTVTVVDGEWPVVTCPSNITTDNDPNRCDAVVNFTASATDNCPGVTLTCAPPSGSMFPVGLTGVECIANDGLLADSCQFTVTVNDTSKPAVSCPANIIAFRSPSQCDSVPVSFATGATDNCPGVSIVCNPSSGSTYPLGATTVTCVATDGAGNQDSCTFTVTVLKGDLNGDGSLTPADVVL
ncbi:MAG TPA: HYR domain-containing protein, partial [candidate division Zixibacteria bacterium]|nr:HYR domain-containing protein [candidate division Zixibacteria bacterium]